MKGLSLKYFNIKYMFKNSVYILKKKKKYISFLYFKEEKKSELICIHYTGMYHNNVFRKTQYTCCHNHGDRLKKTKYDLIAKRCCTVKYISLHVKILTIKKFF